MDDIEKNLDIWQDSLLTTIPIAGLLSRNPIAYKWKAPFRCWLLREAAFWRATDLLKQSHKLHQQGHGLGARILLRSAFETLATLIYLNFKMQAVLDGKLDFHQFGELTTKLTLGSKREDGGTQAVNVLTMLGKGDGKYPGLRGMYDSLSESAHPNFEGMIWGYSKFDRDEYETNFSNRWMDLYGNRQLNSMKLCMIAFQHEYDEVWTERIYDLERWIANNDDKLEATKNDAPKH